MKQSYKPGRKFLESGPWEQWKSIERDQEKGVPPPPLEKPAGDRARTLDLVSPEEQTLGTMPFIEAVNRRISRRKFTDGALNLEELSFLLWCTQGVKKVAGEGVAARTVPSGGCRHPFETYLLIYNVDGVPPGLYRYSALSHQLILVRDSVGDVPDAWYMKNCAVTFIWTAVPYRTEWRYSILSHKIIALDAGHVCQNLYLACEAIGVGTCAVGAYIQEEMDRFLGLDGEEEQTVYVAPVGKV
jgi:SagB-type dehydrogenase family enzyme